jgi:hypothetical protein
MRRPSRWPDPDKLIEDAQRGAIDDTTADLSLADLEELAALADLEPRETDRRADPRKPAAPAAAAQEHASAARRRSKR